MSEAPSSPGGLQARLLILDTGPLWELLLFQAVHQLKFQSLRGELRYLLDEERFFRFSTFTSKFQHKTTTPSVVAELSFKVLRTDRDGQIRMWSRLRDEFVNMKMDEEMVRFVEMPLTLVSKCGAVDCSVFELGRRYSKIRPQILTIDEELRTECRRAGLQALHLSEIIV